jgi:hypothetical protein
LEGNDGRVQVEMARYKKEEKSRDPYQLYLSA